MSSWGGVAGETSEVGACYFFVVEILMKSIDTLPRLGKRLCMSLFLTFSNEPSKQKGQTNKTRPKKASHPLQQHNN